MFRVKTPANGWFANWVGNVPCGSVYADKGTNLAYPATNGATFIVTDASAGQNIPNLVVPGFLALGQATLGINPQNTEGQSLLSLARTWTGTSSGASGGGILDPNEISVVQTLNPTDDNSLAQAWLMDLFQLIPSTNAHQVQGMEGITLNQTADGSGTLGQMDGLTVLSTVQGSRLINASQYDALNVAFTWGSSTNSTAFVPPIAAKFTAVAQGPGTLAEFHGVEIVGVLQPAIVGKYVGLYMDAVSNMSATSYAVEIDGPTENSLFQGSLQAGKFINVGTKFTASGCSNSTLVGGATAGSYHSGTTGTCTVTVTFGDSATAPNGWSCSVSDTTTPADLQTMTASAATTATFSGTTVSGDVIKFACVGY